MIRTLLTIFLIFTFSTLHAQTEKEQSESIADCEGAVNLFKSGEYSIQFTGKPGFIDDLMNYPSLSDISSKNIIWISYIADNDGVLTLDAQINENFLQMIIFQETTSNVCVELSNGTAEIKRMYKRKDQQVVEIGRAHV